MNTSRRTFIKTTGLTATALLGGLVRVEDGAAQGVAPQVSKSIQASVLTIGYEDEGNRRGFPIVLLHGFPDDVRAWDAVVPSPVEAGYRTLRPYLRGCGPTRFRNRSHPRMAEQAAIGQDVVDFADALGLQRFALVGYDWGGSVIPFQRSFEKIRAASTKSSASSAS